MEKLLKNGHAEPAPESKITESNLRWYLPHFEVCHPQKLYKIRLEKRYLIEQDPAIKTRPLFGILIYPFARILLPLWQTSNRCSTPS